MIMGELKFVQINLNKSPYASDSLKNLFVKGGFSIACIQEPKAYRLHVSGLNSLGNVLYKANGRNIPRACIVFRKDLEFLPLEQFCDSDFVAASLTVTINKVKHKLIVCSGYHAAENDVIPTQLVEIFKLRKKENRELVYCCDANAQKHSLGK